MITQYLVHALKGQPANPLSVNTTISMHHTDINACELSGMGTIRQFDDLGYLVRFRYLKES